DRNHVSPLASLAVNPGAKPADFSRVIVHRSGLGARPVSGPRTTSSAVTRRGSTRLVNQLESGTSSIVLTLRAWTLDGLRPGVTKRLYDRSYRRPTSYDAAPDASALSGSRAIGSSP